MKTMKTMKIASLSLLTGMMMLTACSKDEFDAVPAGNPQNADFRSVSPVQTVIPCTGWRDDFTSAASLTAKWYLIGTPQPQFVNFAGNRFGLFDNNGNSPSGSYAVSKARIGNGKAYIIESEVFIDATKPAADIICPEIGVTRYLNKGSESANTEAGLSMKLMYVGAGTNIVPPEYQDQMYLVFSALKPDGTFISTADPRDAATALNAIKVDVDRNGWHKMKILVTTTKQVYFYLDNKFIWSPRTTIDPSLLLNKNVLLGYTSPGTSGKAYHDFVKVTYPVYREEETALSNETGND